MASWREKASEKREAILAAIRPEWRLSTIPTPEQQRDVTGDYVRQFLTPEEITITESTPDQILSHTTAGNWSAVSVVTAFSHRAAIAHQLTNALHEIFTEDAVARAAELDAYLKEHGKPLGPLHGLPVSVKDSVNIKGIDTTNGFTGLVGRPADRDAELARILRLLGAVLYVKTAVPQGSWAAETENNIVGYTTAAQNRLLSAGGSSGGEGPLLAMRGSVVGLGSDIGGSIRHPAALNGAWALKPSYRRLPLEGISRMMEGQDQVPFSWGPLSSSPGGLSLLMRSILGAQPWLTDPRAVEIPWRDDVFEDFNQATKGGRQLVFGLMRDDGAVRTQPPIQRGLDMLVKKVEALGHKVIEWRPPSHVEAVDLTFATWSFDGSQDLFDSLGLSGEPIVPSVEQVFGSGPKEQYTAKQITDTNVAIWRYRKRYMDYWNSTAELTGTGRPVDAVIAPVYPYAGVIPGKLKYVSYTPFANVLDYTVGVLPVTTADKSVDVYPAGEEYQALGEMDAAVRNDYDPEIQHGSPVGISIFGRRFHEEKILGIMEALGN